MGEPIFLKHTDGLAFEEIAGLVGVSLPPGVPAARRIVDVAPLDRAGPAHLTFYDDGSHAQAAASTHAGLCLTNAARAKDLPATVPALVVAEPYQAFLTVACRLFPQAVRPSSLYPPGPSALAHIDPSARLEDGVTVEPGAVIGPRAEIGAGTTIGANAVIGADVRIGRDCAVGSNASLQNALIGDRVIVHPGCLIGQGGGGPHLGRVIVQDRVEIGAGTTIDRGSLHDTVIGEGSKIDNLVQVGHNVSIGRHCLVAAQSGISGSTTLDDFVVLGGGDPEVNEASR
jgi:UDP-3-O-[3-hydroxymyristoyl] glucosamine N-acyltransferase